MQDIVIVAARRTAVGNFGGSVAKVSASDLGATVIKALLADTGVKPEQISQVILGMASNSHRSMSWMCRHYNEISSFARSFT